MKNMIFYALLFMVGIGYQNCSKAQFSQAAGAPDGVLEIQRQPPGPDDTNTNNGRPGDGEDDNDNDIEDADQVAAFCGSLQIQKVIVNVNHLELNSSTALVTPNLASYDLMTLSSGFIVQTNAAATANQLRLVLNPTGNKLVDQSGAEYALKTPSQQNSGLKLILPGNAQLSAGTNYKITATFDPDKSIVRAGSKCLLKPVIRVTSIVPEGSSPSD
jgi:hypothetical protein